MTVRPTCPRHRACCWRNPPIAPDEQKRSKAQAEGDKFGAKPCARVRFVLSSASRRTDVSKACRQLAEQGVRSISDQVSCNLFDSIRRASRICAPGTDFIDGLPDRHNWKSDKRFGFADHRDRYLRASRSTSARARSAQKNCQIAIRSVREASELALDRDGIVRWSRATSAR